MPTQIHHVATRYGNWYPIFQGIADRYGLDVVDIDQVWNAISIPHRGPHPYLYHRWVLDNMRLADAIADGDRTQFIQLYKRWIVDVVVADPTITRLAYWKCRF